MEGAMSGPLMQKQEIPNEMLRFPDLALMAGPREIEFEIELPKGSTWDTGGVNSLVVQSAAPEVLTSGQAHFAAETMRFMAPVTALIPGEAALVYQVQLAWLDKDGLKCTDQREVVQRVTVEHARGATVPWVHFKAQAR